MAIIERVLCTMYIMYRLHKYRYMVNKYDILYVYYIILYIIRYLYCKNILQSEYQIILKLIIGCNRYLCIVIYHMISRYE